MLKNNQNAKDALIMLCYVCGLGAFGAFFRWLQIQVERDSTTGMMNVGVLDFIVPAVIIAAAALLWRLTKRLTRGELEFPTEMSEALRGLSLLYLVASWIIAVVAIIGGVVTLFNTTLDSQRSLYVLIALLAVISGLSFPLICSASRSRYSPSLVSVFAAVPVVMFCVWLIVTYRANSSNPTVWTYAIEIIAVSCIILAFFYDAGYAFGRPAPQKACFFSLFGAFMGITTLSDSRYVGLDLILLASSAMLLTYGWLIVKNRRKKPEQPPVQVEEQPEQVASAGEESSTVLEPTVEDMQPEPTIEAPARPSKREPAAPPERDEVEEIISEFKKE